MFLQSMKRTYLEDQILIYFNEWELEGWGREGCRRAQVRGILLFWIRCMGCVILKIKSE